MAKYNVHGGHNKIVPGASSYLDEVDEDRKISKEVINLLQSEGNTVYNCTDDSGATQKQNLSNIVSKCNAHSVELDTSIHLNALKKDSGDGKNKGVEVLIYSDNSEAKAAAQRVCNNIAALGFTNRGVKINTSLYVLRHTNSPAMLVEVCFVDDKDDADLYSKVGYKAISKAIAEGILNKSVSSVENSESIQNKPESDPPKTPAAVCNYKVKISTPSGVNVRKGPGENYGKITAIANGTTVTITKEQDGWGYVEGKGGWILLKYAAEVKASNSSQGASYKVGETYTLQSNMVVRTGAGTSYRAKTHSELTADGQKHDKDKNGCLDKGTKVTCKAVKKSGNQTWIQTPSGWICAVNGNNVYVK